MERNDEQFEQAKDQMKMIIKALIARDVYDAATSIKIANDYNDIYKKALEIVSDDALYDELLKKGRQK